MSFISCSECGFKNELPVNVQGEGADAHFYCRGCAARVAMAAENAEGAEGSAGGDLLDELLSLPILPKTPPKPAEDHAITAAPVGASW